MKESMKSWREWVYAAVMVGCIQFVVLTVIAMVFYPGGTHGDPTTKGYSFFRNFFSDLGFIHSCHLPLIDYDSSINDYRLDIFMSCSLNEVFEGISNGGHSQSLEINNY